MTKILILFSFFLVSGCGLFANKVESLVETKNEQNSLYKRPKKNLHCALPAKYQIIVEDEPTFKFYRPFLNSLFDGKSFSFVEKSAMLSLVEMARRPDEASPFARLQFFLRLNGKNYYYDYASTEGNKNPSMPYLKALEQVLKNVDGKNSLPKLAEHLDLNVPESINVSPELENFFVANKNNLVKNETLMEFFLKGDEVLTKHESFKRVNFKKFISDYFKEGINKDSLYESQKNQLQKYAVDNSSLETKCNFDINIDSSIKENLLNSDLKKSHSFGYKEGDNIFLAVSSEIASVPFKNYKNTYFIEALTSKSPLPVCHFQNANEDLVLFSTEGRNPSQHIKHLVAYDIEMVDSFSSLEEILNFSRHLFLSSPDRILYESKRGRKAQLDFFLSMNFPIYHVDSLGNIVGSAAYKVKNKEDRSLIVDDRSNALLWCSP